VLIFQIDILLRLMCNLRINVNIRSFENQTEWFLLNKYLIINILVSINICLNISLLKGDTFGNDIGYISMGRNSLKTDRQSKSKLFSFILKLFVCLDNFCYITMLTDTYRTATLRNLDVLSLLCKKKKDRDILVSYCDILVSNKFGRFTAQFL